MLTTEDGIAETSLEGLASIEEVGLEVGEIDLAEEVVLLAIGEGPEEFGIVVEMILDGAFTAPGDEKDLLNTVGDEFLDNVLDDGLARHRKHFLWLGLGGGEEASPQPGDGHDGSLNHHLNIA